MEVVRDMADDLMSRSQEFIHRIDDRLHHKLYRNTEKKWTSRRARIVAVILYAVLVAVWAVVLALYYIYGYHPKLTAFSRTAKR